MLKYVWHGGLCRTGEPSIKEMRFQIESLLLNITDLEVTATGDLNISLDTSTLETELSEGESTDFRASLDMSELDLGKTYKGEISIKSKELDFVIPVTVYYYKITGDFLKARPGALIQNLLIDEIYEKTITLTNDASFPTTDIEVELKNDIADFVVVKEVPSYIKAGKEGYLILIIDGSGLSEKNYIGEIVVTSSLGSESIVTEINVVSDFSGKVAGYQEELADLEDRIRAVKDAEGAAELLGIVEDTKSEITKYNNASAEGDLTGSRLAFEEIESNIEDLREGVKNLPQPPLVDPVVVVVIILLVGGGIAGYFLFKKYIKKRKKQEKKKKKEREKYKISPEERYRVEYY